MNMAAKKISSPLLRIFILAFFLKRGKTTCASKEKKKKLTRQKIALVVKAIFPDDSTNLPLKPTAIVMA